MTVAQLIKKLETFEKDMEVRILSSMKEVMGAVHMTNLSDNDKKFCCLVTVSE